MANFKAVKLPWNGIGESRGVKCSDCKQWITKYDYTKKEALIIAKEAKHTCKS